MSAFRTIGHTVTVTGFPQGFPAPRLAAVARRDDWDMELADLLVWHLGPKDRVAVALALSVARTARVRVTGYVDPETNESRLTFYAKSASMAGLIASAVEEHAEHLFCSHHRRVSCPSHMVREGCGTPTKNGKVVVEL